MENPTQNSIHFIAGYYIYIYVLSLHIDKTAPYGQVCCYQWLVSGPVNMHKLTSTEGGGLLSDINIANYVGVQLFKDVFFIIKLTGTVVMKSMGLPLWYIAGPSDSNARVSELISHPYTPLYMQLVITEVDKILLKTSKSMQLAAID